jgi:hypothetical protein
MLKQLTFALLIGLANFSQFAYARDARELASPKAIVLAFYKLALQDFKPAEAFARYAASDFVEQSGLRRRHGYGHR